MKTTPVTRFLVGILIGLGAVLPGISGGVLCVMFGLYKPILDFLANPRTTYKKYIRMLAPVFGGLIVGFVFVARVLAFFLEAYENVSVCLFVGLIIGMFPSLLKEAGKNGRNRFSWMSFGIAAACIFALLLGLEYFSVSLSPNFGWLIFCGFCLAVSIIVPGMSFSTLLMPLGLYTPFIDGIGHIDFGVILPAALGAVVTIILFSRLVNRLFDTHYSVAFHAVAGIVAAATIMIIPYASFVQNGVTGFIANTVALAVGAVIAYAMGRMEKNKK